MKDSNEAFNSFLVIARSEIRDQNFKIIRQRAQQIREMNRREAKVSRRRKEKRYHRHLLIFSLTFVDI